VEEGLTFVTAEGDEVEVFGLLVAFEAGGHGGTSSLHPTLRKKREGLVRSRKGIYLGGFYVWPPRRSALHVCLARTRR
jgi:hypothetical protein